MARMQLWYQSTEEQEHERAYNVVRTPKQTLEAGCKYRLTSSTTRHMGFRMLPDGSQDIGLPSEPTL